MGGINLTTVMDALASAANNATGVDRVFAYPVEDAMPGDAIVGYPEEFEPTITFGRGMDRAVFPLWIVCGLQQDKSTRDFAATIIDTTTDIPNVIESNSTLVALGSIAVTDCRFESWAIPANGGPLHVVVRFNVEVTA